MSYLDFSVVWNYDQFERFLEGFHAFKPGLGLINDSHLENLHIKPECAPRLGFDFRLDDGRVKEFSARTYRGLARTMTHDKDVMLASVSVRPMSLKYACRALRGDRDVVLAAVEQDVFAIKYAAEKARGEYDVAMAVVRQEPHFFGCVHEKFRDCDDVVWAAVEKDPRALRYASKRLLDDPELVGFAVELSPDVLRHASKRIRNDTSILRRKMVVVEKQFNHEPLVVGSKKEGLDSVISDAEKQKGNASQENNIRENIYR